MQKEIKAVIDGEPPERPFRMCPTLAKDLAKRPVPESAKWHMRHRPYVKGGGINEQIDAER